MGYFSSDQRRVIKSFYVVGHHVAVHHVAARHVVDHHVAAVTIR